MIIRRAAPFAIAAAILLATPVRVAAQDSLATARQLYASAEYKAALTMLDTLLKGNPTPQDRQTIDLYRAFCLVALGGMAEANATIEAMINRDPVYRPNMDDVPPRLRTMFSDARKKLLPGIIQQRYVAAKAAFDRNDYRTATEGFTQVMLALSDPDIAAAAKQPPLSDLRVLASGFNDLTVRALTPAPAPQAAAAQPAVPPVPAPGPPAATSTTSAGPAPGASPGARASSRPAPPIYTRDEAGIVEPIVVRQALPPYPGRLTIAKSGVLDVVINETGSVESAMLVQSVDPAYDRIVLNAVKTWAYQPARREGTPVKFRKRIQIAISPGT